MDHWLARILPWSLLLLFLLRGLLAMQADGTTADEPLHLAYGERALTAGTFLRDRDELNSKMPVSVLNAMPVVAATHGRELGWRQQLFLARLPTLLLAALLGALVWRWATALYGAWGGALALGLYTFCPNILAHGHLVTTDMAAALAIFAAVFCLWRHLAAPSASRLWLAAGAFGAAQLTKATALFLGPIAAILVVLRGVHQVRAAREREPQSAGGGGRQRRQQAASAAGLLTLLGLAAIVALNLGFCCEGTGTPLRSYGFVSSALQALARVPVLRDVPLPLPQAYLQGIDMVARDARAGQWSFLRGRYSQSGFRSYFLWAFAVKVPLATQALLAVAFALALAGRARAPGADSFLLVPVLVLLAYLSFSLQLDIGFRYFLPALPFLFVFAGRVAAYRPRPAAVRRSWAAAAAALTVWLGASSLRVHPHYLAYFNEIAGGPEQGSRWLIDSNLDWGQDSEEVRRLYGARGPEPLLIDPSGPVSGRIAVGLTDLVGRDPAAAGRHAWLREHFAPVGTVGYSWKVFEVTESGIARCCPALPRAWRLDRLADDLALGAEPFAGGEGVTVRFVEKLNDGMLGANTVVDAARSVPPLPHPVRAWFGLSWHEPQTIGRVVAFPGLLSRGPLARRFLAVDYVFQYWDGAVWHDLPGCRATGNADLRIEHRFPPVATRRIRLLVERERNAAGSLSETSLYRAACLELAAYRE